MSDVYYEKLEQILAGELGDSKQGLKPWTAKVAESFNSKSIKELIEDDYFLGMKDTMYPFIRETIEQLYEDKLKRKIDIVIIFAGIGSGKTLLSSVIEWIEWFKFTTEPNPKEKWPFVDLPNSTTAFILMSRDKDKARKVVFNNVYRHFQSQFNKEYFPPNPTIKTYLDIPRNKTLIFPGTGEAVSALGFNVFSAIVDEGAFLQQASKDSSSEEVDDQAQVMYEQIRGRIFSRFNESGGPIVFISSANKDNWMEQKAREVMLNPKLPIFYRRAPLWKAKPKAAFPSGEVFLFNANTFELVTDPDMIKEYMEAKDRNQLPKDYNPLLSGLLI